MEITRENFASEFLFRYRAQFHVLHLVQLRTARRDKWTDLQRRWPEPAIFNKIFEILRLRPTLDHFS